MIGRTGRPSLLFGSDYEALWNLNVSHQKKGPADLLKIFVLVESQINFKKKYGILFSQGSQNKLKMWLYIVYPKHRYHIEPGAALGRAK